MKLAINLATRGRPSLLLNTLGRTVANIRHPDTVLMVSCDDDDAATLAVLDQVHALRALGPSVIVSRAPRELSIGAKWNRVLGAVDADVYMPMCDDGPVITPGFDELVLAAAGRWPDHIGVVFNHLENLSFTGIQAVTKRFAELMGGIYPTHFPYWFVDHWLSDIAEMIDRIAFADVRLDCASNRPATMEMREPGFWATFYDACVMRRRKIAHDIIVSDEFVTPDWEKAILLERHPLIETYSKIINDGVRQMRVKEPEPDERYAQIKAAAVAFLRNEILPELKAAA